MVVAVYSSGRTKKAVINEVVDYHYKRHYYEIGTFEMTVLASDPGEPYKIIPGDILYVYDDNGDDSLYVSSASAEKGRVKLTGYDLKIILNWRVTLFPTEELEAGTYGYDVRTGWTSDIIKAYIDYNLCEAKDPNRLLPNSYCVSETQIGISNDTYMSRLQPLNEVVEALCKNANVGYKVMLDTYAGDIVINVIGTADKLKGGGFGTYVGNADSVTRTRDNSSERTVAWAVNGTSVKDATVTAVNLNNSITSGIERKETVVTINCDTDMVDVTAKHDVGEHVETKEIDASVNAQGLIYDVGDIVPVYDDMGGYYEMQIVAIEKSYSGNKLRKTLHFADYQAPQVKKKPLNKIASNSNSNTKAVIDQKLDSSGGGGEEGNFLILSETQLPSFVHEYKEVGYYSGSKIILATQKPNIVVQSYTVGNINYKDDAPIYTSANLRGFASGATTVDEYSIETQIYSRNETVTSFRIIVNDTPSTIYSTYDPGTLGFILCWSTIYGEVFTATAPEGCAQLSLWAVWRTANGSLEFAQPAKPGILYYPFASIDEYHSAICLTKEENVLTSITETVTEV